MEEFVFKSKDVLGAIRAIQESTLDEKENMEVLRIISLLNGFRKFIRIANIKLSRIEKDTEEIRLDFYQVVLLLRACLRLKNFPGSNEDMGDFEEIVKELSSKISVKAIDSEEHLNAIIMEDKAGIIDVAENVWGEEVHVETNFDDEVKVFLPWRNDGSDCLLSPDIEDFAEFLGSNYWCQQSAIDGRKIEIKFRNVKTYSIYKQQFINI